MKKIIGGILGIFLVIGIVAGVGYAVFNDTVTMRGMVLGTATPGLEIGTDKLTGSLTWYTILPVDGRSFFTELLPGESDWGEFQLRNVSIADGDPLNFNLTGQIVSAAGSWGQLKDAIQMRICLYINTETVGQHCDTGKQTGWLTLDQWNINPITLPGNPLTKDANIHYAVELKIPNSYANEIAGLSITDMNFEIKGTQAL